MVTDFWKANPLGARDDIIKGFIHNLTILKKMSKQWAHNKRLQEEHSLRKIESDLVAFENDQGGIFIS